MTARMLLRDWRPINKGALLGRCDIELPIGLHVNDIAVFAKDGRRWAQMPSEMVRDAEGQPLKDERGKTRYRMQIRWNSRDLRVVQRGADRPDRRAQRRDWRRQ